MMSARLAALEAKPKPRRPLRAMAPVKPTLYDSITRESVLRRVRYLARAYGLRWMIDQATFNKANLDYLEDHEMSALLRNMERARECPDYDISYQAAGLVHDTSRELPEDHSA